MSTTPNCMIDLDNTLGIVHVCYQGTVSLAERIAAVEAVCQRYVDHMPLRILVDVRDLEMTMPLADQQSFGQFLSIHPGLTHARVAVLHNAERNPNTLIDTIAFNNGYKLAEFNKQQDAEHWLSHY